MGCRKVVAAVLSESAQLTNVVAVVQFRGSEAPGHSYYTLKLFTSRGGRPMFCPTCGRDNSIGRKFCASCGTNLEAVSQALSGGEDDFFTKIDSGLDHFLAKYSEHVFKNAPAHAAEQRIARSWQILGQGVLTSIIDLLLFTLMWNIIPLRFLLLLISTPVRLVTQRGRSHERAIAARTKVGDLPEPAPQQWLAGSIDSVTEHTTAILSDSQRPKSGI